jgi:hypothetical protein
MGAELAQASATQKRSSRPFRHLLGVVRQLAPIDEPPANEPKAVATRAIGRVRRDY